MGLFKDSTINPLPSDLEHDALCPPGIKPPPDKCMTCLFIEQVRRDEKACEQRVEETWSAIAGRDQYAEGYAAALDAARERIMRLPYEINEEILVDRDEVIGWIDALREEKK